MQSVFRWVIESCVMSMKRSWSWNFSQLVKRYRSWGSVLILTYLPDTHDLKKRKCTGDKVIKNARVWVWIQLKCYQGECIHKRQTSITDLERRSQNSHTPGVMALSAMELQLGVFRILPTIHAKINANNMCPWSLRTMRRFMHAYT